MRDNLGKSDFDELKKLVYKGDYDLLMDDTKYLREMKLAWMRANTTIRLTRTFFEKSWKRYVDSDKMEKETLMLHDGVGRDSKNGE